MNYDGGFLGDFDEDATVRLLFHTMDSSGGAVAPSSAFEADDVRIYKDGGATQKTSTNGLTMTSPFDGVTGLHLLEIDTGVDTGDLDFWETGHDYTIVLAPDETVDGQTVVRVLGQFSIENRHGASLIDRLLDEVMPLNKMARGTVGEALQAMRAFAMGSWVGANDVIELRCTDRSTPFAHLHMSPAGGPYTRGIEAGDFTLQLSGVTGALTLTPQAPGMGHSGSIPAGSITFTGLAPTHSRTLHAPFGGAGNIIFTGHEPTVS